MNGKHAQNPRKNPGVPPDRHRARATQPHHHDTYLESAKGSNAMVCDDCGVVWYAGRWYWGAPPLADVGGGFCPACRRIQDRYPAGTIRVPERFLGQREELMGMIRNAEVAEVDEHPLERLMAIEDDAEGGLVVTTTGIHLARAIANKLERRFHEQARIRYPQEQHRIQVDWEQ